MKKDYVMDMRGRKVEYKIMNITAFRRGLIDNEPGFEIAAKKQSRQGYYVGLGIDADDCGSETYHIIVDAQTGMVVEVNSDVKFFMREEEK